jgi:hypothetical protein
MNYDAENRGVKQYEAQIRLIFFCSQLDFVLYGRCNNCNKTMRPAVYYERLTAKRFKISPIRVK